MTIIWVFFYHSLRKTKTRHRVSLILAVVHVEMLHTSHISSLEENPILHPLYAVARGMPHVA